MIRGQWKPREGQGDDDDDDETENGEGSGHPTPHAEPMDHDVHEDGKSTGASHADESLVDGLADTMGSLSLVPPSIRFGRGGKKGGFLEREAAHGDKGRGRGRGGRGRGRGAPHPQGMDVDPVASIPSASPPPLGRAGRGRAAIAQGHARGNGPAVRGGGV